MTLNAFYKNQSVYFISLLCLSACATTQIPAPTTSTPNPPNTATPTPPFVPPPAPPAPTPSTEGATLLFGEIGFDALPDWQTTDLSAARRALIRSCASFRSRSLDAFLSQTAPYSGRVQDWQIVCTKATDATISDKNYWEQNFTPWKMEANNTAIGRLTSYFEPVISASLTQSATNNEPLFGKPNDLLTIDLGAFDQTMHGKSVVGRIENARFVPYRTRAEVTPANTPVVAWTNMGDALSLQIQGSGRLLLEDGRQLRVAFAGHNGKAFGSVARELIRRGELQANAASADAIKNWFSSADKDIARAVINANPRTVFFELKPIANPGEGPKGGAGIPLEAGGAIAIDTAYHAYGVPIFVAAGNPRIANTQNSTIRRLLIAQDTGGAIKGPLRGDLYWGTGVEAGMMAGRVNHDASWWVLLPKGLDPVTVGGQ